MSKKLIIILSALLAPLTVLVTLYVSTLIETLLSKIMWSMDWEPFYFSFSESVVVIIGYALQAAIYSFIAWSLKNMYGEMEKGNITTRAFVYLAILSVLSLSISLLFGVLALTSGA
jgi:hypothetical protein